MEQVTIGGQLMPVQMNPDVGLVIVADTLRDPEKMRELLSRLLTRQDALAREVLVLRTRLAQCESTAVDSPVDGE